MSCLFKITKTDKHVPIEIFTQILFVTARFSVNNFSGYLKNAVYKFIENKITPNWHENPVFAKSIMYSFGKMGIVIDVFTKGVTKICEKYPTLIV